MSACGQIYEFQRVDNGWFRADAVGATVGLRKFIFSSSLHCTMASALFPALRDNWQASFHPSAASLSGWTVSGGNSQSSGRHSQDSLSQRAVSLSHHQGSLSGCEASISRRQRSISHRQSSSSHRQSSISLRQSSISHRQTSISHRQTPISHRQTPISHRQTPKNGWNMPFFVQNGLGSRFLTTNSHSATSWHRAC